jgi:hypothetical protein
VGGFGALAAAWVATTVVMWTRNARGFLTEGPGSPLSYLDTGYAVAWFLAALGRVDVGPGIGEQSSWWVVADHLEAYPHSLLLLGVYAVAYITGVSVRRLDEVAQAEAAVIGAR